MSSTLTSFLSSFLPTSYAEEEKPPKDEGDSQEEPEEEEEEEPEDVSVSLFQVGIWLNNWD